MRFFSLIFLLLFSLNAFSQSSLDEKVSISSQNISIANALKEISTQTGLKFSYNPKKLDADSTIHISIENTPVSQALDEIFSGQSIKYKIVEGQIILKKAKKEEEDEFVVPNDIIFSGYLKDFRDGEVLLGATVYIHELSTGAATNEFGFFSMKLPPGTYTVTYSYIGYGPITENLTISRNTMKSLKLQSQLMEIDEVEVQSVSEEEMLELPRMNEHTMLPKDVKEAPSAFGAININNVLSKVPGVSSFGDGSSHYYVRGGSRDQNLILLDDAPVYTPMHLFGLFSTIVPEAVKSVTVYKGDMPANLGGRASSVVDIRTRDGNNQKFEFGGNFNPFIHGFTFEGPIWKNKISFILNYRRSNLNWLLGSETNNNLWFGDITGKINYQINPNNRIYISTYNGDDQIRIAGANSYGGGLEWKNIANSLRWNHIFSERLFMNITAYSSIYDYKMHVNEEGAFWNNKIESSGFKSDFTLFKNLHNTMKFGLEGTKYVVNPGNVMQNGEFYPDLPITYPLSFNEVCLYISNEQKIGERFMFNYGLRSTAFRNKGEAVVYNFNEERETESIDTIYSTRPYHLYRNLQPRISLSYRLSKNASLKASYAKNVQHINIISNSVSPFLSLEIMWPSTRNIEPQVSRQLSAGYFLHFNTGKLSAEAYYKKLKNIIDYSIYSNRLLNPEVESELIQGFGQAYGLELMATKLWGSWKFIYTYAISKSARRNDVLAAFHSDMNNRPHVFSLETHYAPNDRLRFSLTWNISSGNQELLPVGFYTYMGHQVPIYTDESVVRQDSYHRLDAQMTWRLNKKERKHFENYLTFMIYNFYGSRNRFAISYNKIYVDGNYLVPDDYKGKNILVTTEKHILGVIPCVTYEFKIK